jgi:NAD(P)-dependent dehydrogenase (short-subunit alcohol dehydrogenase family)
MQTLSEYFAAYRSLKLTRDTNGVLAVEFHTEADALVKEIRASGGQADAVRADLSLPDGVADLATQVRTITGEQLDVLVSNAGISKAATIKDHTDAHFCLPVQGPERPL